MIRNMGKANVEGEVTPDITKVTGAIPDNNPFLNELFTEKEIIDWITSLKNNKA